VSTAAQNILSKQEIEDQAPFGLSSLGVEKDTPSNATSMLSSPTPLQKVGLEHDMDANSPPSSTGIPHPKVPAIVIARPEPTATQKLLSGHEIDCKGTSERIACDVQVVPSKVSALPRASTAAQKVVLGQDTASMSRPPSTLLDGDHEVPL
jgi:hypothetical protein